MQRALINRVQTKAEKLLVLSAVIRQPNPIRIIALIFSKARYRSKSRGSVLDVVFILTKMPKATMMMISRMVRRTAKLERTCLECQTLMYFSFFIIYKFNYLFTNCYHQPACYVQYIGRYVGCLGVVVVINIMNSFQVDWATLPVPKAEEDITHLLGFSIQQGLTFRSTDHQLVSLSQFKGISVIFIYPRSGQPGKSLPQGWDNIPGARGCTPQTCAFRDHFQELTQLGVKQIFGLSSQSTEYQQQFATRLKLPFPILSDEKLQLAGVLKLPTFLVQDMSLYKRITLVLQDDKIIKYFYPVFPPDKNAEQVIEYLKLYKTG